MGIKVVEEVAVRPCLPVLHNSFLQLSHLFVHGKKHFGAVLGGGLFADQITYHPLKTAKEMLTVHKHFTEVEYSETLHALDQMKGNRTVM